MHYLCWLACPLSSPNPLFLSSLQRLSSLLYTLLPPSFSIEIGIPQLNPLPFLLLYFPLILLIPLHHFSFHKGSEVVIMPYYRFAPQLSYPVLRPQLPTLCKQLSNYICGSVGPSASTACLYVWPPTRRCLQHHKFSIDSAYMTNSFYPSHTHMHTPDNSKFWSWNSSVWACSLNLNPLWTSWPY